MSLSAVVQLFDSYQKQPAIAVPVEFLLNGMRIEPVRKEGAQFILSNLDAGKYIINIKTQIFFPEIFEFDVSQSQVLADQVYIRHLIPCPLYPYTKGTTLLRGMVKSAKDMNPLSGVSVTLNYSGFRGKHKSTSTQTYNLGAYDGRYALSIAGKHQAMFDLNVEFSKAGFQTVHHQVSIENGFTHFLDTNLNPSRE